jgi:hypothetical protein
MIHKAVKINQTYLYYKCPYTKKECSSRLHFHGSKGDMTNRTEHRGTHCLGDDNRGIRDIQIIIDDDTVRK